jgi:hypothetical protein
MGKGPDLSAFPIPRKGGAKPIAVDEATETDAREERREEGEGASQPAPQAPASPTPSPVGPAASARDARRAAIPQPNRTEQPLASSPSGQTVATTVKLDENRYLRLADAGKPGPGRLKRRTIQEMLIEALDEWFERRGL